MERPTGRKIGIAFLKSISQLLTDTQDSTSCVHNFLELALFIILKGVQKNFHSVSYVSYHQSAEMKYGNFLKKYN